MTPKKARPKTIAEYVNAAPKEVRKKLREMRACIRASAPGAEESLKWGMPAFSYGRMLVTFAAFEHHIGFYPTPSAVRASRRIFRSLPRLARRSSFRSEKPLPLP